MPNLATDVAQNMSSMTIISWEKTYIFVPNTYSVLAIANTQYLEGLISLLCPANSLSNV